MWFQIRKPWNVPESRHTPESVYRNRQQHRREFLESMGRSIAAGTTLTLLSGCEKPTLEQIEKAGKSPPLSKSAASFYPAKRNPSFEYQRPETKKKEALEYTNFYEFAVTKDSWKKVGPFKPSPWSVEIVGECNKPRTFDLDDLHKLMTLEERCYRHRCVEAWAMCVPWTGFPLSDLLKLVEPKKSARYVAFETFYRPNEAPGFDSHADFPWPYTEALTIEEAMNELTMLATGLYGEPLAKQNGAPIRLVIPWKYGFKSIKSIVRIRLESQRPPTFWNSEWPEAYDFTANVDPKVPHPSWSQESERMLGTGERYATKPFNGYGDFVGKLYEI